MNATRKFNHIPDVNVFSVKLVDKVFSSYKQEVAIAFGNIFVLVFVLCKLGSIGFK